MKTFILSIFILISIGAELPAANAMGVASPATFPLILADIPLWLNVVAIIVGIVGGGIGIIYAITGKAQRVEINPQPVQVQITKELAEKFATHEQLEAVDRASQKRRGESERQFNELREEMLTREVFDLNVKHTEEWRSEFKDLIERLFEKLDGDRTEGSKQRREIYRKVNAHDAALHFIAGQHERGAEIMARLRRGNNEEIGE